MNPKQAAETRDALAKFMYAAMFNQLVARINSAMGKVQRGLDSIGCLDIFGNCASHHILLISFLS
jgi:myosin V